MDRTIVQRRSQRKAISLAAKCRTQSGLRDNALMSDISAEGCRITANGLFFRVGARVVIRPAGLEGLSGVIRWIERNSAGVQFDTPLYGPVVEHLCGLHATGSPVGITHKR